MDRRSPEHTPPHTKATQPAVANRESARRGVLRITLFTLISNIFLTAIKGITGVLAGSSALISDAANSASDVVFGIVVMMGVKLAGREADADHPYGHERFESLATMFLGAIVTFAGLSIGFAALQKIYVGWLGHEMLEAPDAVALWVAAGVIVFKAGMYTFTRVRARLYQSDVLRAAAADHGADVLGTAGVFIGIAAARMGMPIMDPVASVVIAALIIKTGIDILRGSIDQVTDHSAGVQIESEIRDIIESHNEVVSIDKVRTRVFGDRVFCDVEISLPGDYTLTTAHAIAESIHDDIEHRHERVKHCMVHVNPAEPEADSAPDSDFSAE
ncbi:MAG: cation diffusion facilitator family transporter [Coriobacteriia bacterium]|nr:cation diffusion facilitator family transporter [Coriobacteriia bacterium]